MGVVLPFRRPPPPSEIEAVVPPVPPASIAVAPVAEPPFMWTEDAFHEERQRPHSPPIPAAQAVTPAQVDKAAKAFRKGALRVITKATQAAAARRPVMRSAHHEAKRPKPNPTAPVARKVEAEIPLPVDDTVYLETANRAIEKFRAPHVRECERVMCLALSVQQSSRTKGREALRLHLVEQLRACVNAALRDREPVTQQLLRSESNRVLGLLIQWAWETLRDARSIRDEEQVACRLRGMPRTDVREVLVNGKPFFFVVDEYARRSVIIRDIIPSERELWSWFDRLPRRRSNR
ncbi:MAG: hypothetical protein WA001_05055 [Patescibacteria group bacterium]